jgi:hypothetical protein
MKLQKLMLSILSLALCLAANSQASRAQSERAGKTYQQMTLSERSDFVAARAQSIGREMSGNSYQFTPAFLEDIQTQVDRYVKRIGNEKSGFGNRDLREVLTRGTNEAPTIIAAFKARNVSPLIGLYIPWIESEYLNIQTPNAMGSLGMFQFTLQTGEHYGLSATDLVNVEKSADGAARYISDSLETFKDDPMKESLALLAYNRGGKRVASDLKALGNDSNKKCSICALTANSDKLDATFQNESVYYVPRFLAAAIIGENPQAFGLQTKPLSSY